MTPAPIEMDDVADRIIAGHETTPPVEFRELFHLSGEVATLYRRIGSASLFGGAGRLRPADAPRKLSRFDERFSVAGLIDLADGRTIWELADYETEVSHWACARADEEGFVGAVPLHGDSLAFVLHTALECGGEIGHIETGLLSDLGRSRLPGRPGRRGWR